MSLHVFLSWHQYVGLLVLAVEGCPTSLVKVRSHMLHCLSAMMSLICSGAPRRGVYTRGQRTFCRKVVEMMGDRQVKAGASAVLVAAKRSERGMARDHDSFRSL